MKRLLAALFLAVLFSSSLFSQGVWPVQMTRLLIPPRSTDLSVYSFDRKDDLVFTATLVDPVEPFRDVRLNLTIENFSNVIWRTDPNAAVPIVRLFKDQPEDFDGVALASYLTPLTLVGPDGDGKGSIIVPEGFIRICVEVIDVERNVPISAKTCVEGEFVLNKPPLMRLPECNTFVTQTASQNLIFNWTPMHIGSANSPGPVKYTFKMIEFTPSLADANDGFDNSLIFYETETTTPSLLYTQDLPQLQVDQTYAWRVTAEPESEGMGRLFQNEGNSSVCTFTYLGEADEIPLVPARELDRKAPNACLNVETDFGPVAFPVDGPINLLENEIIRVGYFEMEILSATPTSDGYSGEGLMLFPMLGAKIRAQFQNLKTKSTGGGQARVYEADWIRAEADLGFEIDENEMETAALDQIFSEEYCVNLIDFFENGNGQLRKRSIFDQNSSPSIILPMALDKKGKPTVFVADIRWTPRNCFLTYASVIETPEGKLLRFAEKELQATPFGLRTNSALDLLDAYEGPAADGAFTLRIIPPPATTSRMNVRCDGFDSYFLQSEAEMPISAMTAPGGGSVRLPILNAGEEPFAFFGSTVFPSEAVLTANPSVEFSVASPFLDFSSEKKGPIAASAQMPLDLFGRVNANRWQGGIFQQAVIRLPGFFGFEAAELPPLDGTLVFEKDFGATGVFSIQNAASISSGRLGEWPIGIEKMTATIRENDLQQVVMRGAVKMPTLSEAVVFEGKWQKNGFSEQLSLQPTSGKKAMAMWRGSLDLAQNAEIRAGLHDFGTEKSFLPESDLSGVFSAAFSGAELEAALKGDKTKIVAQLRTIYGFADDQPALRLEGLRLRNFVHDPLASPAEKFTLGGWDLAPGAAVSIGGQPAEVRDLFIEHDPAADELYLIIWLRKDGRTSQVALVAEGGPDGYVFERLEIEPDVAVCDCRSSLDGKIEPTDERQGQILERVFQKFYAPDFSKKKSSAASAGASSAGFELEKDEKKAAELAEAFKKQTLQTLRDSLFGGFSIMGGVANIEFLGLQIEGDFTADGSRWVAAQATERKNPNFQPKKIETLQLEKGPRRLPILLDKTMLKKMGLRGVAIPKNSQLLITSFEIEADEAQGIAFSTENTALDFTLLSKIEMGGGSSTLAQFVRGGIKVSPTQVDLRDFFLFLDSDVPLSDPEMGGVRLRSLRPTDPVQVIGETGQHSFAHLTCDEFRGFSVVGEYAAPERQLLLRDLEKTNQTEAEKPLRLAFLIEQKTDLSHFLARIKPVTSVGEPLQFIAAGHQQMVFRATSEMEAFVDFDPENDADSLPEAAGQAFRGVFFRKIQVTLDGLTRGSERSGRDETLTFLAENLWHTPASGLSGACSKMAVLPFSSGWKLGGIRYAIDRIDVDFSKNNPLRLAGRLRSPLFSGKDENDLLPFFGTFSFDAAAGNYFPTGDFQIGLADSDADLVRYLEATSWAPGLFFQIGKGSRIAFRWADLGRELGFGLVPMIELSGFARLYLSKKWAEVMGAASEEVKRTGIEMNLPPLFFEGFGINLPDGEPILAKNSVGLRTFKMGDWGVADNGTFQLANLPPIDGIAAPSTCPTAACKVAFLEKRIASGLMGFPIGIESFDFEPIGGQNSGLGWEISLDFFTNLLANPSQPDLQSSKDSIRAAGVTSVNDIEISFIPDANTGITTDTVSVRTPITTGAITSTEFSGETEFVGENTDPNNEENNQSQGFEVTSPPENAGPKWEIKDGGGLTVFFNKDANGARKADVASADDGAERAINRGGSLDFDGENDQVVFDRSPEVDFWKTGFTVECWAKPAGDSLGAVAPLISQWANSAEQRFSLCFIENKPFFIVGSGLEESQASSSTLVGKGGEWVHLAGVFDPAAQKICLYVNGNEPICYNSRLLPQAATTALPIIGGRRGGPKDSLFFNFKGQIDEARFWAKPLSINDIRGRMNCEITGLEEGLASYFRFNQGVGSAENPTANFLKSSKKAVENGPKTGPDGLLQGFALAGSTSNWLIDAAVRTGSRCGQADSLDLAPPAERAAALAFDGKTGCVDLPASVGAALAGNRAFSIEFWYSGPSPASAVRFSEGKNWLAAGLGGKWAMSFDGGQAEGLAVFPDPAAAEETGETADSTATETAEKIDPTVGWHHFAMTWKRGAVGGFKTFFDGQLVAERDAANVAFPLFEKGMRLGCGFLPTDPKLAGQLDEVRFWNRAITADEILGRKDKELQTSETGLVGYWRFNRIIEKELKNEAKTGGEAMISGFSEESWEKMGAVRSGVRNEIGAGLPSILLRGGATLNDIFNASEETTEANGTVLFGKVDQPTEVLFTIDNGGLAPLFLPAEAVKITGTGAKRFTIERQPATGVAAGNSTTFHLKFLPTKWGEERATVSIRSSDLSKPEFRFSIKGVAK